MPEDSPQGAGAGGVKSEAVSAAQLFIAIAEIIRWWAVVDDAMGTNNAMLQAVLKAVAAHKRDGQILHVDEAGRRITARHLRLGAASERLMVGLQDYKKGVKELDALAAEIQADFDLDIRDSLQDKVSKNAGGSSRKVKDVAHLAGEIISLAAKRRDPALKAAGARFIQTMRGVYKDAVETIAAGEKRRRESVAAGHLKAQDTKAERSKESQAWAVKVGFEQAFNWQEDAAATPEQALMAVGHFRLLLHRLGGEEAMRKELYTYDSCVTFLVRAYGLDPQTFSVVPQLKAQPS